VQANQRVYRLAAVGRLLLTDCCGRDARFTVVETPRKCDPGQPIVRNRGNVGLNPPKGAPGEWKKPGGLCSCNVLHAEEGRRNRH
jgi:hypothetical protein